MIGKLIRAYRKAYGAGWRAGMAEAPYFINPFNQRRQLLLHILWANGWHDGTIKSLNKWLKSRKGENYVKHYMIIRIRS